LVRSIPKEKAPKSKTTYMGTSKKRYKCKIQKMEKIIVKSGNKNLWLNAITSKKPILTSIIIL
jgi:hypothetical protein